MRRKSQKKIDQTGTIGEVSVSGMTAGGTAPAPVKGEVGRRSAATNLILHIHPRVVPAAALRLTLTWGLGGMALVLFMLLAASGILLLFVYEPTPGKAHASLLTLGDSFFFGPLVRNIHYVSANALMVVAGLHLARVLFTNALHGVRRTNWFVGLGLLLILLASGFTGYLLPWDQLAYWAITIATGMAAYIPAVGPALQELLRGGAEVGEKTLLNFFMLHSMILPAALGLLLPFHFWLVRKAGGVTIGPPNPQDEQSIPVLVPVIPNLVTRELALGQIVVAAVLVGALLLPAPLGAIANPGMSPNPAKAPWYFAGIQELFVHFHPFFAVFIIPVAAAAALVFLPALIASPLPRGVWFASARGGKTAAAAALLALILTPAAIAIDEALRLGTGAAGKALGLVNRGVLPFAGLLVLLFLLTKAVRGWGRTSRVETVQALAVFLLTAFIVLSAATIWLRGEGMALAWPGSPITGGG